MTADAILALARSFMPARILLSAAELDVFSRLVHGPRTAAELAREVGADERGLALLLDALAALGLLEKAQGRYACPAEHAAALAADAPRTVLPMLLHQAGLWHRWTELTGVVRGDGAARERALQPRDTGGQRAFIGAMHVVGADTAAEVVRAAGVGAAQRLLDIGGASGTYTLACLAAAPRMRATLFDLPDVVALARERLGAAGVLERVELVAGDFYTDELPGGHDLALLSAIIHQNSRAENVALYQKAWRALVPGGRLVIRDHIMSRDRTQPTDGAIFAINMLVGTRGGTTYTLDELREDLAAAGFERVRCLRADAGMHSLVEAFRPA